LIKTIIWKETSAVLMPPSRFLRRLFNKMWSATMNDSSEF
jgi:hypothetical protein